jgi:hypothetical protein
VFKAVEWPDNYANRCGVSVYIHINVTEQIEMMVACIFMVSSMTHYVQTYLLDSHLSVHASIRRCLHGHIEMYLDGFWSIQMVYVVLRQ